MAYLSPEGWLLDAGTWRIAAGQFIPPSKPLALCPETLPVARRLVAQATETLPHAIYDDEGMATLARSGELTVEAVRAPDGSTWAVLAWTNGSGAAGVPLAEIETLGKVLAEAEEELAGLGLTDTGPSMTH